MLCLSQLSSSCVVQRSSLKCVEVRTLLACVAASSDCSSSPLSVSLPVTLLLRPDQPSTPLHLLTVRTAATAPTRDSVQLASGGVYECEVVVECDGEDESLERSCDVALHVMGVEMCHGPSMEYCERVHWWPAMTDTQRRALLPWVMTDETSSDESIRRLRNKVKDKDEHKHKRKHTDRKQHHRRRHKSNGSRKRANNRNASDEEAESEEEHDEEKQQPVASDSPSPLTSTAPTLALSSTKSPRSTSTSSSPSPTKNSALRYPPCCACGPRTTCSRAKSCCCVAAGQRCGHCATDFCENDPKTKPHQRATIVSRHVVQQYQRAMKQHAEDTAHADSKQQFNGSRAKRGKVDEQLVEQSDVEMDSQAPPEENKKQEEEAGQA